MFQMLKAFLFGTQQAPKHVIEVRAAVVSALTELHVKAESFKIPGDEQPLPVLKIPVVVMAVANKVRNNWRKGIADAHFTKQMIGWVKKAHRDTGYTIMVAYKGTTYCVRMDF